MWSLPLLAQGADWIALEKPAGLNIHSEDGEAGLVVQASALFDCPLWPVHRLDKVTSGIVLLATSAQGAARLGALFAQHQMYKTYLAQSSFKPKKKQGRIKGDMKKGRNGNWLLTHDQTNPAITDFTSQFDEATHKRLFILRPLTGKTHQLRVAMKSLGSPIDGDTRYGGQPADRTYLHAYRLSWQDDLSGQQIDLLCPPSDGVWITPIL